MMADWSFFSNHGLALLCIARDTNVRIREIAEFVGIRERAAQRIVSDLVEAGYVIKYRQGNRNRYELGGDLPMRHPLVREHRIGEILEILAHGPLPSRDQPAGNGPSSERRRGERRRAERRSRGSQADEQDDADRLSETPR